jgi:hypothetical protein
MGEPYIHASTVYRLYLTYADECFIGLTYGESTETGDSSKR